MVGPLDHADRIARLQLPLDDDAQVRPGPQRLGEAPREQLVVHADAKSPARDPRLGNLQDHAPDLPALADQGRVHVHAFGREVLAELAVGERSADRLLPPARVLDGVGVDRLVGPAVGLAIRLVVAGQVHPAGRDPPGDRRFPDRAPGGATAVLELAHAADIDGEDLSCGRRHELPSFQVRRHGTG
jgi:hypothetical protein